MDGWVNVDLQGEIGVSPTPTDLDHYYIGRTIGTTQKRYIDLRADVTDLPDIEAERILAVHILEHFPQAQAPEILAHWFSRLRPRGRLMVDVPDVKASALLEDEWAMRLIYGSEKDEYSFHRAGFTEPMLTDLLHRTGFDIVYPARFIVHDYPTIQLIALKCQ